MQSLVIQKDEKRLPPLSLSQITYLSVLISKTFTNGSYRQIMFLSFYFYKKVFGQNLKCNNSSETQDWAPHSPGQSPFSGTFMFYSPLLMNYPECVFRLK